MMWEKQYAVLHVASKEWLTHGRVKNVRRGGFRVDAEGNFGIRPNSIFRRVAR